MRYTASWRIWRYDVNKNNMIASRAAEQPNSRTTEQPNSRTDFLRYTGRPSGATSEPEAAIVAIAREIQHLVHSLPRATTDGSRSKTLDTSLLSNASFMNGSSQKRKPSVWDILENLHCTSPNSNPNPPCSSTTSSPTYIGSEAQRSSPEKGDEPTTASSSNIYPNQLSNDSLPGVAFSDTSSIMVYSPLLPTQSDLVELAELVPYDTFRRGRRTGCGSKLK